MRVGLRSAWTKKTTSRPAGRGAGTVISSAASSVGLLRRHGRRGLLAGDPVDGDHRDLPLPRPHPEVLRPQVQDRRAPGVDRPHHDRGEGDVDLPFEVGGLLFRRNSGGWEARSGPPRRGRGNRSPEGPRPREASPFQCTTRIEWIDDPPGVSASFSTTAPCGRCSTPAARERSIRRSSATSSAACSATAPWGCRSTTSTPWWPAMAGRSPSGSPRRCRPGWSSSAARSSPPTGWSPAS